MKEKLKEKLKEIMDKDVAIHITTVPQLRILNNGAEEMHIEQIKDLEDYYVKRGYICVIVMQDRLYWSDLHNCKVGHYKIIEFNDFIQEVLGI